MSQVNESNAASQLYQSSLDACNGSVSMEDLLEAGAYKYGQALVNAVNEVLSERGDLPQAKLDDINEAMTSALHSTGLDTPAEAMDMLEVVNEMMQDFAKEAAQDGASSADKSGSASGSENWLVALARAMGEVAGKHLENMVELSNKISSLKGSDTIDTKDLTGEALEKANSTNDSAKASDAREMAALTAEMQAESQMFKMTQEMTTTVVKGIGEALHSTSRKQ